MFTHLREVCSIAFSRAHIEDPNVMYPMNAKKHLEVVSISNKKISKAALIILGIATLGIGWLIYDFYTAHRKVERIHHDHLNLSSIILSKNIKETAITYNLSGGRLGDNLMCFLSAYYVAYKNKLPFYFTPFKDSDQFLLSDKLEPLAANFSFKNQGNYNKWDSIDAISQMNRESSTLIKIDPFADARCDWRDPGFKNAVKELIKPKVPIPPISLPPDRIPIALHVRTGGGFAGDTDAEKLRVPAKFPPKEFYSKGLQAMINAYGKDQMFYVHIFTDDPNPSKVAAEFQQQFPDTDIEFGFRKEGNKHNAGVLDDFFGMTQFKGLIRPWSGLSQAAEIIGNQELVYEPSQWIKPVKKGAPVIVPGKLNDKRAI